MGRIYTFDQALEVVSQLVKLLHQAHLRERADFDITPAGVVVEMDGEGRPVVRLRDVEFEDGRPPESLMQWRYRAPERWWGARKSSVTDQYALAALFVELVTGKAPFAGVFATNDFNVVKTVLANRPADLAADCPRRDVLLRALAKDPRSRYPTCSEFAAGLANPTASAGSVHRHHHHHHHGEGQAPAAGHTRRKSCKGKVFLVLLAVAAGIFWAERTGNLERWLAELKDFDGSRAKQQEEARKQAVEKAEKAKRERAEKLAEVREAVKRQSETVEKVRRELQDFLKTGDASYLSARLTAQRQRQKQLADNLPACEREVESARSLERALDSLARLGVSGAGISKEIPADSEVVVAYRSAVEEAVKMRDLRAQFTEKHPSVIAQAKVYEAAAKRLQTAMAGALSQARAVLAQKEGTLSGLRDQWAKVNAECEKLEHEVVMAQSRKSALEGREARETDRLVELQRKEIEIEFGKHQEPETKENE